jgi:hypothetical protein
MNRAYYALDFNNDDARGELCADRDMIDENPQDEAEPVPQYPRGWQLPSIPARTNRTRYTRDR